MCRLSDTAHAVASRQVKMKRAHRMASGRSGMIRGFMMMITIGLGGRRPDKGCV